MKLGPRDLNGYFKRPDPNSAGILIFGEDAMRVALKRQDLLKALLGPNAEDEMRLTRLPPGDLRNDPATLIDAVKSAGFFATAGPRAVFVDGAGDGLAPVFKAALDDWQGGDAQIVVTAGRLTPKSALRKVFEGDRRTYAAAIYDDPPSRDEVEAALKSAGVGQIDRDAMADILALAQSLDPGDFRQTVEKLGLYKRGDPTAVMPADVAAIAPLTIEAEMDDILHATAEANPAAIGPLMARLGGQGVAPVTLCIMALRHFRALHAAASHPGGPQAGLSAMRPPVFGPRRDRMQRQVQRWGMHRLEGALSVLVDTDLTLRSSQQAPQLALMERALIRLAMMADRKGRA